MEGQDAPRAHPGDGGAADGAGGEPVCWLHLLCPGCGRIGDDPGVARCPGCGTPLPQDG